MGEPEWGKISRFEISTVMEKDGHVVRVHEYTPMVSDTSEDPARVYYTLYEVHDPKLDDGFGGAMALVDAELGELMKLQALMRRWTDILRAYKRVTS